MGGSASGNNLRMTDAADHTADPAEVEPTNNSTGEPVDLNKVEQIEDEVREDS